MKTKSSTCVRGLPPSVMFPSNVRLNWLKPTVLDCRERERRKFFTEATGVWLRISFDAKSLRASSEKVPTVSSPSLLQWSNLRPLPQPTFALRDATLIEEYRWVEWSSMRAQCSWSFLPEAVLEWDCSETTVNWTDGIQRHRSSVFG